MLDRPQRPNRVALMRANVSQRRQRVSRDTSPFLLVFCSFSLTFPTKFPRSARRRRPQSCAMADPPSTMGAPSPISKLLQSLGMTREDLVLHTEQMRAHLSQGSPPAAEESTPTDTRSRRRSRTVSLKNIAQARQLSPPRTPVKPEPIDAALPPRQMDTMQMVMEHKQKQSKKEQKGAYCRP